MTTPTDLDDRPNLGPELLPGVSRITAIELVERMQALYAHAESRIAADIARRLARGMDSPAWAADKLAQIGELRRSTQQVLARLGRDTSREVTYVVASAYMRGGVEASRALVQLGMGLPPFPDDRLRDILDGPRSELISALNRLGKAFPNIAAMMRLAASLVLRIKGTFLPVLRWAEDSYRTVIAETALSDVLSGTATRRVASQRAWEQLLNDGITGFTDKAGRHWNLATYVEMATRTGAAQAAVEGHLDRLTAAGHNLVVVSDAPQECIKCRPWEGKILELNGPGGPHHIIIENVLTGVFQRVQVAGTVAEALLAGLMHPNCRHSFSLYVHGATRIPTNTEDPEGDAARQQLRALERKVRKEKFLAAAAIDPLATKAHERNARAWQKKIREHVKATEHLGIFRKPEREQIVAAR